MKKALTPLISIIIILFIAGGIPAVCMGLDVFLEAVKSIIIALFPVFEPAIEKTIKDYLTSGYFIGCLVACILSSLGIIFTRKAERSVIKIVSIIADIGSFASIASNLAVCSY